MMTICVIYEVFVPLCVLKLRLNVISILYFGLIKMICYKVFK